MSTGRVAAGGVGGLGILGVIIFFVVNLLGGGGGNLDQVLNQLQPSQAPTQTGVQPDEFQGEDSYQVFAETVLGSTDDTWTAIFQANGLTYTKPKLVLFRDSTDSGCGGANSQVGPHYCPLDQTIYLDETFFDVLKNQLGGSNGDVAQAYVIAHEVGHHVQNELNIMDEVQRRQQSAGSQAEANTWSVKLELQADCFGGVWANSIRDQGVFQPGEINEAIDAASAVGDDRIQQRVQGQITPETWTHGSAADRVKWFNVGWDTGDPSQCDTFQ
jgi:predicted metalloprotease